MIPKLSRAVLSCLALLALTVALPALAEPPAVDEPSFLEAPICPVEQELPLLDLDDEQPQAASCTTCPAEPHACSYNFECDAYCNGCSGNCVLSKYSVCPWIEITFPRVCQCA